MSNIDELDLSLEKLLELRSGSSFIVNSRFKCTVLDNSCHDKWTKDANSPSMTTDMHVNAVLDDEVFDGMISFQNDMSLSHKFYAALFIKHHSDTAWCRMFTVVKVSFG